MLQDFVMFGLRRQSITIGDLTDLDAALCSAILLDQLAQFFEQYRPLHFRQRLVNGVERDRLLREINDRFKQGCKIWITHSPDLREPLFLQKPFPVSGKSHGAWSIPTRPKMR